MRGCCMLLMSDVSLPIHIYVLEQRHLYLLINENSMANRDEARQRTAAAAQAEGRSTSPPRDSSLQSSEPLRTTGYTTRPNHADGSNYANHVVLAMAAGLVVILVVLSWANDSVLPSGVSTPSSSLAAGALWSSGNARIGSHSHPEKTVLRIYHDSKICKGSNYTSYETTLVNSNVASNGNNIDDESGYYKLSIPEGVDDNDPGPEKSMQIIGPGEVRLYNGQNDYVATVVELERCTPMFKRPPIRSGRLMHRDSDPGKICQVDPEVQKKLATKRDITKPHTRIVYSAESSDYFGYQTYTNAFAFLNSSQTDASWLRLLTCEVPDDLSKSFPTFTAPRSLYSKRYAPINKPDVIEKWFNSECDAPHPDDIIVVIDPDNFLMRDLAKWTSQVSRKNALGQAAYYVGMPVVQQLWKEVCEMGCDKEVDAVGVPYVVKASDLAEVAPLWRMYAMKIKELVQTDQKFKDTYERPLNIMWAAEMYAYNFACAHLSIKTKVVRDMQARDVDRSIPLDEPDPPAMIHMGRAWFPKQHAAAAEPWRHTEGEDFLNDGSRAIQVFCKCNQTASTIIPWPVPSHGLDWQSYHTLRLMHDGLAHFGPVPVNTEFRHEPPQGYSWTKN